MSYFCLSSSCWRVQGANPEFLVRSSFHQFQQEASAPALEKQAEEIEAEMQT